MSDTCGETECASSVFNVHVSWHPVAVRISNPVECGIPDCRAYAIWCQHLKTPLMSATGFYYYCAKHAVEAGFVPRAGPANNEK